MELGLNQPLKRWWQPLGFVAIVALTLSGVILLQQSRLKQPSLWIENPAQATEQEKLRLQMLKQTPTFGFDNLSADWVFLNFLQYYGDEEARKKTGFGLSPDYFDIITQRDPRFTMAYLFLSGSVSYQLGKPELAIAMMQRGTVALSPQIDDSAFQVWRLQALDQLLLLGDIPGAIKSFEQAANWTKGTSYAEIEPILRGTADFLRTDPNSKPVRVVSWGSIYEQAMALEDKQTATRAKKEILALGGRFVEKDGNVLVIPPPRDPKKPGKK
ncbi:MAG: hypothetical protein NW224_21560 [Leptolyngbyaceae cyanobacterium bins.302]|nr:hypothetical protein [Leptolyngbyaceae cyanobacterium bins.302]